MKLDKQSAFPPFQLNGCHYDLSHLNAFYWVFRQAAKGVLGEKIYRCVIEFSHHCFSKSPNIHKGETLADYDKSLHYVTDKETRIFDMQRYHLSQQLPAILRNMDKQKCYFTSADDKFMTVSLQQLDGSMIDYEIYFSLKKSKKYDVHIFINSAYARDEQYKHQQGQRPIRRKPISFFVLLHNTLANKKIKRPK
ncbi:hypothetical protein [Lonepinella koalarum]|uniref:Uncharacterized protein n=1 Tax=Lonepinella koalarum TaxID=53417 RepID=A0A4R1KR14_9PAST|nr:hypothetical protein [Lonepinella koalarum]MDH2926617.1 hypothetical protein [Lonepinella koalarum]TCK66937.1 hypothetical protein EV692_2207 [Lonepinella koalarum]TFJ88988.1 hypothetical protein E0709_11145 [Lonepinella koalarum]